MTSKKNTLFFAVTLLVSNLPGYSFAVPVSLTDDLATLLYDFKTGNLSVEDGTQQAPSLRGMNLSISSRSDLAFTDSLVLPPGAFAVSNDVSIDPKNLSFSTFPVSENIFGTGFQFGDVLPPQLTQNQLDSDLEVFWQRAQIGGGSDQFRGDILVVPEPRLMAVAFVGIVLATIQARRRSSRGKHKNV